jgi:threonine aldolase
MFVSDNVSCVCPGIVCAIDAANIREAVAYGGDGAANDLDKGYSRYFEAAVAAFPAGNGTAANALALAFASLASSYCHQAVHIATTECGPSEAWAGGNKLMQLSSGQYCIDADTLRSARARVPRGWPQSAPPAVVSLRPVGLSQIKGAATLCNDPNGPHYRLVIAWNSTAAGVDKFVTAASGQGQLGGAA